MPIFGDASISSTVVQLTGSLQSVESSREISLPCTEFSASVAKSVSLKGCLADYLEWFENISDREFKSHMSDFSINHGAASSRSLLTEKLRLVVVNTARPLVANFAPTSSTPGRSSASSNTRCTSICNLVANTAHQDADRSEFAPHTRRFDGHSRTPIEKVSGNQLL